MRLAFLLALLASPFTAAVAADETVVRRLLAERQYAAAETGARALADAQPGDAQALALLGRVLIARQDGPGAVQAYERAVALAPGDSGLHLALGDAHLTGIDTAGLLAKPGMARRCLAAYHRAVELDPDNLAARLRLLRYFLEAPALFGGSRAKARAQAEEIGRRDAASGHLAFGLLHANGERTDEALAEFEQVVRLQPDHYLALFQIGRLAAISGRHVDRGIAALTRVLALAPPDGAPGHAAAHWRLGLLHAHDGDLTAARASYEAALRLDPAFPPAVAALQQLR
jgi:tetratricopeptide (TPR) repeat protein